MLTKTEKSVSYFLTEKNIYKKNIIPNIPFIIKVRSKNTAHGNCFSRDFSFANLFKYVKPYISQTNIALIEWVRTHYFNGTCQFTNTNSKRICT